MTVEEIIQQVTEICKENHVEHLSLFGSYAKGTATKYSDLDFIIYGKADMERLQEQVDDRLVKGAYHEKSKRKHGGGDVYLEAENAAYTVVVALSGKLCGEYSRSRQSTEYCEVIYEYHLVCDRNAGHLLGAESADHQVVEHRHELRYSVLYHDRYCYCKRHFVKLLCSDKRSDFHLVSDFRKFCGIVMIY